jgi:hypothetical protein
MSYMFQNMLDFILNPTLTSQTDYHNQLYSAKNLGLKISRNHFFAIVIKI